jgi:hypothetical protein
VKTRIDGSLLKNSNNRTTLKLSLLRVFFFLKRYQKIIEAFRGEIFPLPAFFFKKEKK